MVLQTFTCTAVEVNIDPSPFIGKIRLRMQLIDTLARPGEERVGFWHAEKLDFSVRRPLRHSRATVGWMDG